MKHFYILLIFTQLIGTCTLSLLPFRSHDNSIRKTRNNFEDSAQQSDDFDLSDDCAARECDCLKCNNTLPKPKKVINPYKEQLSNRVPLKPFGTFCVKCAACLAVADEMQKVIKGASQECETDLEKRKILLQDIDSRVHNLCDKGFKNFDLRSYSEHGILTDNFQCTTHIVSTIDGNWTRKLREICHLYISRTSLEMVSLNVLDSFGNLTDTFCRGNGIFRDCTNIKSHENIIIPPCTEPDCC